MLITLGYREWLIGSHGLPCELMRVKCSLSDGGFDGECRRFQQPGPQPGRAPAVGDSRSLKFRVLTMVQSLATLMSCGVRQDHGAGSELAHRIADVAGRTR